MGIGLEFRVSQTNDYVNDEEQVERYSSDNQVMPLLSTCVSSVSFYYGLYTQKKRL